jgi:hypothetical protein
MLKIHATQTHQPQDRGYVGTERIVGYFPVSEEVSPYQPQLVKLVQERRLERTPTATQAWVAHDGHGNVSGFTVESYWVEECANPEWELSPLNVEGFEYEPPEHCDSDLSIG